MNYPPRAPANLGAVCVAIVIGGAVATYIIPRLLLPVDSDSGVVAWIASMAELPVFLLVGYHHVSARVLKRRAWFDSRYGGPGELLKLLCLAPMLVLAGCHVGAACARSLFEAAWVWAWFVLALHFTLLDNAPILQRFGLKFSAPSKWRQCGAVDVGIGAVLTAVALSLVASLSTAIIQGGAYAVAALAARLGTLGALLAAAWLPRWATHSFHLHHYVAALAALPWTAASNNPGYVPCARCEDHPFKHFDAAIPNPRRRALALQAAALGVLVESSAVWGLDPCLVPRGRGGPDVVAAVVAATSDLPTLIWLAAVSSMPSAPQWRLLLRVCAEACAPLGDDQLLRRLPPAAIIVLERTAVARPTKLASLLLQDLSRAVPPEEDPPLPSKAAALVEIVRRGLGPSASAGEQEGTCLGVVVTVVLGWFAGAIEIAGAASHAPEYDGTPLAALPAAAVSEREDFWQAHGELRAVCAALEAGLGEPRKMEAQGALQAVRQAVCAALAESFL